MVKIRKHLVPSINADKITYGGKNPKKYIVIHETDNTNKGSDADAHSRLQYNGNNRNASWHYQVDDKEIVQSFDDNVQCWAASNRYYNENSIQIEICVNSDGDFKKAVDNAVDLTKHLMAKHNIPKSNVIQHNKASGKNCPFNLRSGAKGVTWSEFLTKLDEKAKPNTNTTTSTQKPVTPSKPKKTIAQMAKEVIAGKHGNGHANRKKSLGISNAEYEKVRDEVNRLSGVKVAAKPKKSINQMADEVVKGLHGNGHAKRQKSLGVDNATYAKVRVEVNKRFK